MSADPRDLRLRGERADHRNEVAQRLRDAVRAEERGQGVANALWMRRVDALLNTSMVPSDDFAGAVE